MYMIIFLHAATLQAQTHSLSKITIDQTFQIFLLTLSRFSRNLSIFFQDLTLAARPPRRQLNFSWVM